MYRIRIATLCWVLTFSSSVMAQSLIVPIWPNEDLVCKPEKAEEIEDDPKIGRRIRLVNEPSIEVFLPPSYRANGTAVLICPGGGYSNLAYDWEGTELAKWYNRRGMAACVLKYRLPYDFGPECREKVALADAQRAMRLIRTHALDWHLDSDKIGVMGFSAGGHLASSLSTHFDLGDPNSEDPVEHESCRPDFAVLIYPVISAYVEERLPSTMRHLLGNTPDPDRLDHFSNEKQVGPDTPPTFLLHAADDMGVPVGHSLRFFDALQAEGVPCEMHIYPKGGHGFALAENHPSLKNWLNLLELWLSTWAGE